MTDQSLTPTVYIIHENDLWIEPLIESLDELGTPYVSWFINHQLIDFQAVPPNGVFYNRMSASSHTRGNRFAPEATRPLLMWLEAHGRTVVNGSAALDIELSKVKQLFSLAAFGIKTPSSIVVNTTDELVNGAEKLGLLPFILKPNRGGKGSGVQLFKSIESLERAIAEKAIGESIDGLWLIQEYIKPADGSITRVEMIGGEHLYSVKVIASDGFDLCPADSCQVDSNFCPIDAEESKFTIHSDYSNEDIPKYQQFLLANDIGIGAVEYAKDANGDRYAYDVNTNTNYNRKAELAAGDTKRGMMGIAAYLTSLLNRTS